MKKLTIAVIFGGHSTEYDISLQSSYTVLSNLDNSKYDIIAIGITKEGDFYRYYGDFENIPCDKWTENKDLLKKVLVSPDRSKKSILELSEDGYKYTKIDVAFPVLHGKNGEDGTVQALFELAGIPLVGCNTMCSALCMDKDRAHNLVSFSGIPCAKAVVYKSIPKEDKLYADVEKLGYPVFVKPVKAGSSFGISKVKSKDQLLKAVETAFENDDEVIIEENIDGFEIGCAVLGNDDLFVGRIDEIELTKNFFDFTEKYTDTLDTHIYTPARISEEKEKEAQETAKKIYKILGCLGFARVDMFLQPNGRIVFNEVNTIPGLTSHSRYPSMMRAVGKPFNIIVDELIALALSIPEKHE